MEWLHAMNSMVAGACLWYLATLHPVERQMIGSVLTAAGVVYVLMPGAE